MSERRLFLKIAQESKKQLFSISFPVLASFSFRRSQQPQSKLFCFPLTGQASSDSVNTRHFASARLSESWLVRRDERG